MSANSETILTCAVVCEAATIDQQNRAVIYGIFSQIQAATVPATHPQFAVFCIWEGEPGDKHSQIIKIVGPKGETITETPTMNFEIGRPQARLISQFNLMRFNDFGVYKVKILLDGKLIREIPLEVVNVKRES